MTGRERRPRDSAGLRGDTRSVSVTVNYALNLVVATMLIGGVLTATGGMVQDRRESAARTELSVIGERIAGDLMAADRLAQTGSAGPGADPTVSISTAVPERVAGTRYDDCPDALAARGNGSYADGCAQVVIERVNLTTDETGTVRDVRATVTRSGDVLRVEVGADGFPRALVRRLVAAATQVARGAADAPLLDRLLKPVLDVCNAFLQSFQLVHVSASLCRRW